VKDGFITKESLWDRVLLDGTRAKVIGEGDSTLRGVIVSGGTQNIVLYISIFY
jgi:long-chain acyl-CoA synthetase